MVYHVLMKQKEFSPGSLVEKRERPVQRFDDPLWWEKDRELFQTHFGREVLLARREAVFDAGYCDSDHPLQAYIAELAKQLPQLQNCRVCVTPFDDSENACAFADGTFFITPKLIVGAESEESILGVLLHEWRHYTNEHSKIRYDKAHAQQDTMRQRATSVIEGISAGRMHEYIADIQGAVVELDKLGKNPLGYKAFLEKLAQKEGKRGGGIVHGATQERVLNVTELLATIHLPSTDKPLTPLDTRVASWAVEEKGTHGFPALHEPMYGLKPAAAKELMEEQLAEVERIPQCLIPAALKGLWSELGGKDIHAIIEKRGRSFHAYYLPPIVGLGKRLANSLLPADKVRENPFAAAMAVSAMYVENTLLPSRLTVGLWSYIRGELEYTSLVHGGLSSFLTAAETCLYDDAGVEKGMIVSRDSQLVDTYVHWLEARVPNTPNNSEEVDTWWKLAVPMARTAVREIPYFLDQANESTIHSEERADVPKTLSHLFFSWAVRLSFPQDSLPDVSANEKSGYVDNPKIVALHERLFSHPSAGEFGETNALATNRDRDARLRKMRELSKRFNDLERLTLKEVGRFVDGACRLLFADSEPEKVFQQLYDSISSTDPTSSLVLFLIEKKFLDEHTLFQEYPELAKKIALFAKVFKTRAKIVEGYKMVLDQRQRMGIDRKEPVELAGGNLVDKDLVDRLIAEVDKACSFEDVLKLVEPNNYAQVMRLLELFAKSQEAHEVKVDCLVQAATKCASLDDFMKFTARLRMQGLLPADWNKGVRIGPLVARFADELKAGKTDKLSFEQQVGLGELLRNPTLLSEYSDLVANRPEFTAMAFPEKVTIVVGNERAAPKLPGAKTARALAETESFTRDEYRRAFVAVESRFRHIEETGSFSHGLSLLMEQVLPGSEQGTVLTFLKAAISTQQDDSLLRTVLLKEIWRKMEIFSLVADPESDQFMQTMSEIGGADPTGKVEEQGVMIRRRAKLERAIQKANELLEELYRLQDAGKHLLLRKLLGGAGGVLQDSAQKGKLLKVLREAWIEQDTSSKLVETIERVERSLVADDEWEVLYLGLVGVLRDRSFRQSTGANMGSWRENEYVRSLESELGVQVDVSSVEPWENPPDAAVSRPWRYPEQWTSYAERKTLGVLREIGKKDQLTIEQERTPLGFIKEVVSHSSAVGVRSLQNIGQAVELSTQDEKELSDVYDQVNGQSRIAAVHHMERVWPAIWETYKTINSRIGGGSVFTVFQATTHQGEKRVIKTLNPNIGYNLERAGGMFVRSAERLAADHGGAYRLVPGLIEDIRDSIRLEMNFAGFLEKDKAFYDVWNGFGEDEGRYRLRVPRSYGPEQPEFIQEEFVEAKNLTRWDELKGEKHDLRQITRLLATAYVGQLAQGHALSDIHPGNEAVTQDNELVLFDRTLYLQLSPGERTLMMRLFTDDSNSGRAAALEEYFTASLGVEVPKKVVQAIRKASRTKDIRTSQEILLSLREAGLRPPLQLMFILKNLRMIDGMAKKAGWKRGMVEAING